MLAAAAAEELEVEVEDYDLEEDDSLEDGTDLAHQRRLLADVARQAHQYSGVDGDMKHN